MSEHAETMRRQDGGPRVSIGLPVYNGERFLERSVDSLRCQTLADFELIISDNASTDGTWQVCRRLAAADSRIRLLRNDVNLGAAANFNTVFREARGTLFKWASSDDMCRPDLLERCVHLLERRPDVVLCYGKTTLIDSDDRPIREHEDEYDLPEEDVVRRFRRARRHHGLLNVLHGVMRSVALRRTALMGNFPGSDESLAVELSLYGKFFELPERLFLRRMHEEAASASRNFDERLEHLDPKARKGYFAWNWRHHREHLAAILRAPLGPRVKGRLALVVLRSAVSARDQLARELRSMILAR
jgi:glycosyltransferase involved in cell wall biosynthesis